MNLGERCDEIVRLIDQTLADLGVEGHDGEAEATVTPLPTAVGGRRAGQASSGPAPAEPTPRAVAGF